MSRHAQRSRRIRSPTFPSFRRRARGGAAAAAGVAGGDAAGSWRGQVRDAVMARRGLSSGLLRRPFAVRSSKPG